MEESKIIDESASMEDGKWSSKTHLRRVLERKSKS